MKGVWKFVGGCFVGAASAIVVSPKSGRDVRRQIARRLAAGLERTGVEDEAGPRSRKAAPVWLEEEPPAAAEPQPRPAVVQHEPVPEPEPDVVVAPEPEPVVVMVAPEPEPEPEPMVLVVAPELELEPEPEPEPVVVVDPEPKPEPEPFVLVVAPEPEQLAEEPPLAETPPIAATMPVVAASPFDDLVAEPEVPSAPPPGEPLEHPGLEDLRARIEQTKAAVREALERPFVAEEGVTEPAPRELTAEESEPVAAVMAAEPEPQPEPVVAVAPERELAPVIAAASEREPVVAAAEPESPPEAPAAPVTPEAALVTQIDSALEPSPAMPPASPAEGAGLWVVPETAADSGVSAQPVAAFAAPVSEEETADLGPQLRSSLTEVPMGQVPAVPVAEPAAPAATEPAPVSSLDKAVAEAFSFDETAEEPVEAQVVDQAEMRRRIEETRTRLKAKAFDAMTGGEAALLAREPDAAPPPPVAEEPEAQLDDEVRQAIDRSLTQDDF
jgi:hypothetical protein